MGGGCSSTALLQLCWKMEILEKRISIMCKSRKIPFDALPQSLKITYICQILQSLVYSSLGCALSVQSVNLLLNDNMYRQCAEPHFVSPENRTAA